MDAVVLPGLHGACVAFVNPRPGTPEMMQLAEILARRGGITVRMFSCTQTAEEWLLGLSNAG